VSQTIKVKLKKSLSGRNKKHQLSARAIGLNKINKSVEIIKTPENMGIVNKISYLVDVEE